MKYFNCKSKFLYKLGFFRIFKQNSCKNFDKKLGTIKNYHYNIKHGTCLYLGVLGEVGNGERRRGEKFPI